MEFNSLVYLVFLVLVFGCFWTFNHFKLLKTRNLFLLLASYLFYGWWDARFLVLIFISSLTDNTIAVLIGQNRYNNKFLLIFSLVINLGLLFVFKYYDFFIGSFYHNILGVEDVSTYPLLNIALPAGISFYTFQTLSYTIDVYRKEIPAERSFLNFFLFVSYFPQLVAGPIEKASSLLPQLRRLSQFRLAQFRSGIDLIVLGLCKKVLIADQFSPIVERAFGKDMVVEGNYYFLAAVLFSVQIYCDFSAYSDIAIGSSRLLGVRLSRNFNFPYFSKDPREFWKNWHMSLYRWLRDYVYIPLGGNKVGKGMLFTNILVVFFLSGLWHGANWTFIIWGIYNGVIIIVFSFYLRKEGDGRIKRVFLALLNYALILLGWILFRADSFPAFLEYLASIFSKPWKVSVWDNHYWALWLMLTLFGYEFLLFRKKRSVVKLRSNAWISAGWKVAAFVLIYLYADNGRQFIYFQF